MYDDVEADFWKENLVHLIHKNMIRINAERLTMNDAPGEFEKFQKHFPDLKVEIQNSTGYITWEIFVTANIKLRLFIQQQIKVTLLQLQKGDLVKIADGKFPYNPFPEIIEFIEKKDEYEKQLSELTIQNLKYVKQQKLTGEIIKALLAKKFKDTDTVYHLELLKEDFALVIEKNGETIEHKITMKNFAKEIQEL